MRPGKTLRKVRDQAKLLLGFPLKPATVLSRKTIAQLYLRGEGLEIGALHDPLPVPAGVRVRYVDWQDVPGQRAMHPETEGRTLVNVDILDDGERLAKVGDGTQDFLIANHFLEHCEDPVGAIGTFLRVLRPGGIVFLTVPDKRFTFDKVRPATLLEHLLRDATEGPEWSRRSHYEEQARLVEGLADEPSVSARVDDLLRTRHRTHFHVWTQTEMMELFVHLQRRAPFDVEIMFKQGIEVVFILRKPAMPAGQPV